MDAENPLRALPPVQRLLDGPEAMALSARHGREAVKAALRQVLEEARRTLPALPMAGRQSDQAFVAQARDLLDLRARPSLRRVINATGIVLHTNLGRAPLAAEALAAAEEAGAGYSNLEFDLGTGRRGSRTQGIEPLLQELAGSEAALAVNNGAGAILLALSALAQGGEVIVSRGELVEIGGGFRIPDVIRQGGAKLVEVGSTNRTRITDYAGAIGPDTRVLLKVHQSNYRIHGFTEEAGIEALSSLARERGLALVVDLGSGLVRCEPGLAEPSLAETLAAGADIVTCSGDKLLGGPQAGLILGREDLMAPIRRHPLLRALRLDKLTLAALEATLRLHRDSPDRIPVMRMLRQTAAEISARASRLAELVGAGEVIGTEGFTGGGSLPGEGRPSAALAFDPACGAVEVARRLREGDHPVVGRIAGDRLLIDLMAVSDEELPRLACALVLALA